MNAYLYLMIFILFAAVFIRDQKQFLLIACIAMFVLYGLHKATVIGIDSSSSYYVHFLRCKDITFGTTELNNIGFELFTKVFYNISNGNYQLYITAIAAFVTFSFYRFLKKYSINPLLSIMWYIGMLYYIFMFSALKQSIAMAILYFAFDKLVEKKPVKFIIIVLIAASFHLPALVFLPAYWLSKIKIGRNYIFMIMIALAITYIFREQLLSLMVSYYYSHDESAVSTIATEFLGGKVLFMIFVICIGIILRVPEKDDWLYNTMLIFAGIAVVFQTFCYYNNVFERLADYYYQFSVLLIPLIFENREQPHTLIGLNAEGVRNINICASFAIIAYSIWHFYQCVNYYAPQAYLPFVFFWE